jgi:hypothetical protein
MVLLDAGKFTAYCRWCWWSSPSSGSLGDAHRTLASHRCPARSRPIGWCAVYGRLASAACGQPGRAGPAPRSRRGDAMTGATCRRRAR